MRYCLQIEWEEFMGKLIKKKVQEIMKEKLKLPTELKEKRGKDEQRGLYYVLKISTTLKF